MIRARLREAAMAAAISIAGCDSGLSHAFGGYPYNDAGDCLDKPGVVDVLEGPPKACNVVRCFEAPSGDVYVTDQACDAPPDFIERTDAAAGPCVKALCAYADEGHGRCPRASRDAGADCGS